MTIKLKDKGISKDTIDAVYKENMRQLRKWGFEEVEPHRWLGYLTEEVGELAQAINKIYSEYDLERIEEMNIFQEAIQVATLALKIAEMHHVTATVGPVQQPDGSVKVE